MKIITLWIILFTYNISIAETAWYTAIIVNSKDECVYVQAHELEHAILPKEITKRIVNIEDERKVPTIKIIGDTIEVIPGFIEEINMCIFAYDFSKFLYHHKKRPATAGLFI